MPDINQAFTGNDVARLYNEYHGLINNGWEYVWDSDGQVPYLKVIHKIRSLRLMIHYPLVKALCYLQQSWWTNDLGPWI